MSSEFNDNPEIALGFLDNERGDDDALQRKQEVVSFATHVLLGRGALIAYKSGRFDDSSNIFTTGELGTRIYRGTEPVKVGDSYIALRHGFRDVDRTQMQNDALYLVKTTPSDQYLLDTTPDVIASLHPFSNHIMVPRSKRDTHHHIDAVYTLLETIENATETVPFGKLASLSLPALLKGQQIPFSGGAVVNTREVDSLPYYHEILTQSQSLSVN